MAFNRDFLIISGGRFASALLAIMSIRLVTTYLTPEQYGELALLITVQSFCGLFLVNPVGQYINLHTHAWWEDGTLIERLTLYRRYITAVAIAGVAVVLFTIRQPIFPHTVMAVIAMFLMVVAGTWNATYIPMLNMLGYRSKSVIWGLITVSIGLIFSISLTRWIPSAIAWFTGQAIGMSIGAVCAGYILKNNAKNNQYSENPVKLIDGKSIISYCLPLSLATGLMWTQLSGYRYLIEHYWGLAELGYLAVGMQLAGSMWSLAESLATQFLYPMFFKKVSDYKNSEIVNSAYCDLINTLVPIYFLLNGMLILGAPSLLNLLVARQFENGLSFLVTGACFELCRVIANLLSTAAHVKRKTYMLTVPYGIGACVTILLVYLAAKYSFQIQSAAYAILIGALAMLLAMVIIVYRNFVIRLDYRNIVASGIILITLCGISTCLPKYDDVFSNILFLVTIGIIGAITIYFYLKTNESMARLINVELRS